MKIKIFALCAFFILIQCTVDQDEITDFETQNLTTSINIDFNQTPNPVFDTSKKGLYQGTVATHDMSFHEKITINLENDGNYNAIIKGQNGRNHIFRGELLKGTGTVAFKGDLGYFKVRFRNTTSLTTNNIPTVEVFNAFINQTNASITAFKDRSTERVVTSLGTFASDGLLPGDDGTTTGTWDFTFVASSSLGFSIPTLTIMRNGGSTFVLDTNGDYQRLCSAPGTPVPIGVVNSSFFNIQSFNSSIDLAGATLNYTIVGNRLESTNAGCRDFPSANLDINTSNWSWNGIQGTATLNTSSLPSFSGI